MPAGRHDERRLAAFHEAGHTVASVMRGGSSLTSVSLSDERAGEGMTWARHAPWDHALIVWAGLRAEARYPWGERDLEDTDDDGLELIDYLLGVLLTQPDAAALHADPWLSDIHEWGARTEEVWQVEMERVWGAVQAAAARLYDGEAVSADMVEEMVYEGPRSLDGRARSRILRLDEAGGMKRVVTAMSAVLLAASLAACGGSDEVKTASSTTKTTIDKAYHDKYGHGDPVRAITSPQARATTLRI